MDYTPDPGRISMILSKLLIFLKRHYDIAMINLRDLLD